MVKLYKNAYVILQIDSNEYISATLVLANSLRNTCITNDLIVMINSKINEDCRKLLLQTFDKIIVIDKISKKMSVNKLLAMQLYEYKKVIIIDADSLIFKNIDFLFESKTPALIDNKIGNTGIIIVEPNKEKFIKIKKKLKIDNYDVEEILKSEYNTIYKLDKNILDSNKYDKNSYGIQYNKNKPFLIESDIPLEKRIKLDYFNLWYYYFRNVINKGEELSKYKCINNVIELSKNYLPNMIKFMLKNEEILLNRNDNIIKNVYNINKGININNYHTNISLEYKDKELIYNTNNYVMRDIIKYYNTTRNKNIKIYDTIDELVKNINKSEIENFLNMYIRLKTNVYIIIDIKDINQEFNKIKNSIIYTKEISGNSIIIKNIIFDIDNRFTYNIRLEEYNKLIKSKKCKLKMTICEDIINSDYIYNDYKNGTILLNDQQTKIRISSILLNNNTLDKYSKKEIGMINIKNKYFTHEILINKMKEETIKKWIYNNYSVNNIEKILIDKNNKEIIIYECFKNKEEINKIEIIKIKKDNNNEMLKKIINNEYYEKDGIKYML
jgi:hypothetical protein